jgi:hypothetical protein
MKRTIGFQGLSVVLGLMMASVVGAQTLPTQQPSTPSVSSAPVGPGPHPGDRNCLQSTGSLIPAKPGTCLPVAGRSYSQQDLRNTGQPNVGPALQQLDPSITVSGGH